MDDQSTPPRFTRRRLLASTVALSTATLLGGQRLSHAATRFRVHETRVITQRPELYHGWPTLARRQSGQLMVVCSGGRESHVCPFGRVEFMTSDDDGRSWSFPRVLLDSAIDDRDAGVLETAKGTLLVTSFSSLAWEGVFTREKARAGQAGGWSRERLERWGRAASRADPEVRKTQLGEWMLRSTNGGLTWSSRYTSVVNSPHGPIQLADGRLLYAGKELWGGAGRAGVCESRDDGQTWKWLASIPHRAGDELRHYHELHAVETADGRLLAHIRNHNTENERETLQSESDDGGRTWTIPHSIGVWGLPSHLLRLRDGGLIMTFGHRRAPLGNQARVSRDHGRTWSEAMVLSGDGASGDLGYPSTVELGDGSLLSVWYEKMRGSPHAVLRQARWSLEG